MKIPPHLRMCCFTTLWNINHTTLIDRLHVRLYCLCRKSLFCCRNIPAMLVSVSWNDCTCTCRCRPIGAGYGRRERQAGSRLQDMLQLHHAAPCRPGGPAWTRLVVVVDSVECSCQTEQAHSRDLQAVVASSWPVFVLPALSQFNQNTSPSAGIQVPGWEGAHPRSASSGDCCQGCRHGAQPLPFSLTPGRRGCHGPDRLQEGPHASRIGWVDVAGRWTCLRVSQAAK